MKKEKIGYKVSVFNGNEKEPDVLLFYHMSEREMIDWVESLLSDPLNDVTHVVQEQFKIAGYE